MISWKRIKVLARRLGKTLGDVCAELGCSVGSLYRSLTQPDPTVSYFRLKQLAEVLKVPLEYLDTPPLSADLTVRERSWHRFHYSEEAEKGNIDDELERARICLSVTRGLESYLQPAEMNGWNWFEWLKHPPSDDPGPFQLGVRRKQAARENCGFLHQVVCPSALFVGISGTRDAEQWLGHIDKVLSRHRSVTGVALEPDWEGFAKQVTSVLPRWAKQWDKVTVIDRTMAVIRYSAEWYGITYHPEVVACLLGELDRLIGQRPELPDMGRVNRTALKAVNDRTFRLIADLQSILARTPTSY